MTGYNLPKTITQSAATTSFAYSAERVRIKQTAPGETTVYINPRWDTGTHYEKTTKPITGGSVTEHQHYIYSSHGPVAVYKVIATTTTCTTTTSHTRYLHHDHLSSVDAITSETGTLSDRGRVESRLSPALPHQTVHALLTHTAFRCSSRQGMRISPTYVY